MTGSAPEQRDGSTAGLSHTWKLETSYYSVDLPIWIDEVVNVDKWKAEFVTPDAREVVQVVGAWIYCFRKPVTEKDLVSIFFCFSDE